jgi:hypothetical protein
MYERRMGHEKRIGLRFRVQHLKIFEDKIFAATNQVFRACGFGCCFAILSDFERLFGLHETWGETRGNFTRRANKITFLFCRNQGYNSFA